MVIFPPSLFFLRQRYSILVMSTAFEDNFKTSYIFNLFQFISSLCEDDPVSKQPEEHCSPFQN